MGNQPSNAKTVYVVQLSHLDIGFTGTQREVAVQSALTIEHALQFCEKDPDYKWTIETTWQLRQWMEGKSASDIEKLMARIREGRISLGALYANYTSAVLGAEEIHRAIYEAGACKRRYRIPLDTAIQNDIPGYTWAFPQVLSKAGIRYFVGGRNLFIGGSAELPKSDNPFWWEGPDGSRILTWLPFKWEQGETNYLEGAFTYGLNSLQAAEEKLLKRLKEIEDGGYPYDAVLVIAGTGDNADTNLDYTKTARAWNEKHKSPRIVIATPGEFFRYLEKNYGNRFPVYRGDAAGVWEASINPPIPHGHSLAREARERILTAEKLASLSAILAGHPYPADKLTAANRRLLEADEHSGGGGVWPEYFTPESAREEASVAHSYPEEALKKSQSIIQDSLESLAAHFPAGPDTLVVFNPLCWERTSPVRVVLPPGWRNRLMELVDRNTRQPVHCQVDAVSGELIFIAYRLPSFGIRLYDLHSAPVLSKGVSGRKELTVEFNHRSIENQFLRLVIGEDGHPTSLFDKRSNRELLNREDQFRFGQLVMAERVCLPKGECEAVDDRELQIVPGLSGPAAVSLVVNRKNSPLKQVEFILYSGIPQLEVRSRFDLSRVPSLGKEKTGRVYDQVFPFSISQVRFRYDSTAGWLDPLEDRLPGASPVFSLQHGGDLNGKEGGARFALRQAFLVGFEKPHWIWGGPFPPRNGTLSVRLLTRNDTARYKGGEYGAYDPEPGAPEILLYEEAFSPYAGRFDPVSSARFSWEYGNPPEVCWHPGRASGKLKNAIAGFLSIEAPNLMLLSFKQAEDGESYILRVMEIAGQSAELKLQSDWIKIAEIRRTGSFEEPVPNLGKRIVLKPREIATLRLRVDAKR